MASELSFPAFDWARRPRGATGWQGSIGERAFVVELPAAGLGARAERRHVRALVQIAEPGGGTDDE